MKKVYAPGCAFVIYKQGLVKKVFDFLNKEETEIEEHLTCCRNEYSFLNGTEIINTCSGCDRRFRELSDSVFTTSLWERLANSSNFEFPDYGGKEMTVHDACPTRNRDGVHASIRKLLERMNITIVEPQNTKANSVCCGDSYYGVLPTEKVKEMMKKRSLEMPCEDVVVYCISCIKAMHIGGKRPRYIIDLLFNEATEIGIFEPDDWHKQLQEYIDIH